MTSTTMTVEPIVKTEPRAIVRKYMLLSSGVCLLPLPVLDMTALAGLQIGMLNELSKHYGVKFSQNTAKNVLGSLLGSFGAVSVGTPALMSFAKMIPIMSPVVSFLGLPAIGAAGTYAVGKVFIQHFASGGTFLSFDPDKARAYFEQQFKEGQKLAADAAAGV